MHALIPCMLCVVIDPDLTIQLMHHYPLSTGSWLSVHPRSPSLTDMLNTAWLGHNFMEVLRVIDSLMLTRQHKVSDRRQRLFTSK